MKILSWLKSLFKKGIRTNEADEKKLITLAKSGQKVKLGTPLEVKPNFVAVLCYHNKVCDIFEEGKYRLDTNVMPMLTRMQKLTRQNRRGDLPKFFRADIYYINKKTFENEKFYSSEQVVVKDKDFKNFSARLCGTFSFHVKNPIDFLETLFLQYGLVDDNVAKREIESWISYLSTKVVQKNRPKPQALFERDTECFAGLFEGVSKGLFDCGISLLTIEIDDVKFPKKIFKNTKFSYKEKYEPQTQEGKVKELLPQQSDETLLAKQDDESVQFEDAINNTMETNNKTELNSTIKENYVTQEEYTTKENAENDLATSKQISDALLQESEVETSKFDEAEVKLDDESKVIRYKLCPNCLSQCSADSLMCFNCGHIFKNDD